MSSIYFDMRGVLPFPTSGNLRYTGITRVTLEWARLLSTNDSVRFIAPGLSDAARECLGREPNCGVITAKLERDTNTTAKFTTLISKHLPSDPCNRDWISRVRRAVAARVEKHAFPINTRNYFDSEGGEQKSIYFSPFIRSLPGTLNPLVIPVFNLFDIIPIVFKDPIFGKTGEQSDAIRKLIRAGSHFIVNSHDTRHGFISLFGISNERVHIVPLGVETLPDGAEVSAGPASRPYFLYVCSDVQRRKNIEGTIRAFSTFLQRSGSEHELIIVGGGTERLSEMIRENSAGRSERIRGLGRVDEGELRRLYHGAECGLFLSLYEGFGLPVLEYMNHGVPVICSNVTSIPEVAGDSALLVDPFDQDEVVRCMMVISMNPELRGRLATSGRLRAARFSWERSTSLLLGCLDSIRQADKS